MKKLIFTLLTATFIFISCDSESAFNETENQTTQNTTMSAKPSPGLQSLRKSALTDSNYAATPY